MLRRSVGLLALVGLAACDVPTELPRWDQTWVAPGETIEVSAAELIDDVDLNADSTAFVTETPSVSVQFSLVELCGSACSILDGLMAPKPAFTDTLHATVNLPADMTGATLAGGLLDATVAHDFNFDPLRPSSDPTDPRGYMVVRVTSNGNVVAYDSISGDDTAFPEGSSISPTLAIQPVQVADTLNVALILYSPAGDETTIETADTLGVTVHPSMVEISEITVSATTETVTHTTTMDFGADSTVVERIQNGSIRFDVSNPFAVTGSLDVVFQGVTPSIQRTLTVSPGQYSEQMDFTGDELSAILGAESVDVVATGTVTAIGGSLTVTPDQEMVLDNEVELVLLIGPTEDL